MSTTVTILQVVLQYSRAAFGFCQIGETRFEFVVDVSNAAGRGARIAEAVRS